MSDQFRLDGRVALINGGAGGIGGGLCLGLSKAGAKIVIADMLDEKILQKRLLN
jgi:gluconate 5-dehydrogenase